MFHTRPITTTTPSSWLVLKFMLLLSSIMVVVVVGKDHYDDEEVKSCIPPKNNGDGTFSGILLLQVIGRPPFPSTDIDTMKQIANELYQTLVTGTCDQNNGAKRQLQQVEIIPDLFGTISETIITSTRQRRRTQRGIMDHNEHEKDYEKNENDLNDLFDQTRDRYLQMVTNNTSNNNNTGNSQGGGIITRPVPWLARLSGSCNGCMRGEGLFNDISYDLNRQRQRNLHRLTTTTSTTSNIDDNNTYTTLLRGGKGGGGDIEVEEEKEKEDVFDKERLLKTSSSSSEEEEEPEICYCPGPQVDVYSNSLTVRIDEVVQENNNLLSNLDGLDQLIRIDENITNQCSIENVETYCTRMVVRVYEDGYISSFHNDILSWERLKLAIISSFNNGNLLNGIYCDVTGRRITNVQPASPPPRAEDKNKNHQEDDSSYWSTSSHLRTIYSNVYLDVTFQCIGCNGILFDDTSDVVDEYESLVRTTIVDDPNIDGVVLDPEAEEENEEEEEENDMNDIETLDKKKEEEENDSDHHHHHHHHYKRDLQDNNNDWVPFCFCPINVPKQSLNQLQFQDLLNDAIIILRIEQNIPWSYLDVLETNVPPPPSSSNNEEDEFFTTSCGS